MASNSEANLSSDFDLDEVMINWDEQNYSSKGIEFQLPQHSLPSDAKTSQNTTVTLANLVATSNYNPVATSQQNSLQGAQNSGSFYSSFFGAANNPSVVRNSKSHGYSSRQAMASPSALSFSNENINMQQTRPSSNASMLQFVPNLVGQNGSLASQFSGSPMQNIQNSGNLINDGVSPFTDHGIDDNTDLFEGPLDRLVDEIMDRQQSTEPPPLTSSYDDDTPVITYSNRQGKAPNLSSSISPQNVPGRSVLSPNAPSRNVSSPSLPAQNVPSPIHSIPSPNAPNQSVPSPSNPTQNILSQNQLSRNAPVQQTTKIFPPNISPPNVPSPQNSPSSSGLQRSTGHTFSTIQGLSSQTSEQGLPSQSHSKFRLQSPVSVPSSMVITLGQSTMKVQQPSTIANLPLGQTELPTNSLFQSSPSGQRNNQSFPSFMLQNTNQSLIRQPSVTSYPPTNTQSKPFYLQSGNSLEELLRMQRAIRTSSPNLDQADFKNQLARSSPNFSSVLTNTIVSEKLQSNIPSFVATNTERSTANASSLFNDDTSTSDLHFNLNTMGSPSPTENKTTNMNAQNINISQYNRTSDQNPKTVSNQAQTSVPQNVTYPSHVDSDYSSISVPSSLQNDELQKTSIGQTVQNPRDVLVTTQPLNSPRSSQGTVSSSSQFFFQNSSKMNHSTSEMDRQEKLFANIVSAQPQNVLSNNFTQFIKTETPSKPQQSKSVFTLVSSAANTLPQANTQSQVTSLNSSSVLFSAKNQPSTQSAGITTIKISSPSAGTMAGFKYPTVGFSPSPKAVSIQAPRATTIRLNSPTNVTTSNFPSFRLTQGTSASSPNTKPMVFTLAPGSQVAATLKGLPGNFKDKLTGRPVIFLQQPSGQQPINTPKPQPMKIMFVNDCSIAQVVSGPVKSKVAQSSAVAQTSAVPVLSQAPAQTVASDVTPPSSIESKPAALPSSAEDSTAPDSEAGSPASVNSADSDSISIAALKQSEALKKKEDTKDGTEQKSTRGRKRRKDPNRPVKPLSSFQRFFQTTQPTIRQQNPQASFGEVSKSIKEMWETLTSKDKKVYQDAWRMERVQYKKAMDDYNASLEIDSGEPAPKQVKSIEIKEENSSANQIPVLVLDSPIKKENIPSPVVKTPISPTVTSPSTTPANPVVLGSPPAPRSTGKPLAMMAELANKTKLATAQATQAAKAKSYHLGKNKASNGVEEVATHVVKKKAKINPLPKKSCVRALCNKPAKTTKERGTMFCSDDCLMRHCRGVFKSWVQARRETSKAAAT